ncbi:hypothetical protein HFN72_36030 [Rhizobium laguerreae]|uniref:hypothetical protein n=1 Tax=Rhizobium laguerreae TaxID=1076926 RepID=UPI0014427991|nr:hypothetical protein [Rhizobium laguerreae]MBY3531253.1 hypothetical protein [Rhizobium laguerreae]NKM22421.1 hypothetical protein [Rhizobium laguerreae]
MVAGPSVTAGVAVVRGRDDRLWAFGWCAATSEGAPSRSVSMRSCKVSRRGDRIGEKTLWSQFHSQDKARLGNVDAIPTARGTDNSDPDPGNSIWEERFAAALGESGQSAVSQFWVDTVVLVEEPFGEAAPLAASRISGGPDLPPDVWPSNARGMRHPFLINLQKRPRRERRG